MNSTQTSNTNMPKTTNINKENVLSKLKTPTIFYAIMGVIVFLIILLLQYQT